MRVKKGDAVAQARWRHGTSGSRGVVNAAARLQPPPLEQRQERDLAAPHDDGHGTGRSGAATPDPGARKAAGGLGFRLLSMGMKEREREM